MNKKIRRISGVAAAIVATVVTATACGGQDNFRDVKGVKNLHPDYIVNYNNMDQHPNIGFLCINGLPIITTTRDYNALTVVPYTQGSAYAYNICKQHEHPAQ